MSGKQKQGTSSTIGIRVIVLAFISSMIRNEAVLAETEVGDVTFPIQDSSAGQNSVLTGNINIELLSITLPAGGLEFTVDTQEGFRLDSPGLQFEDMGLSIINRLKIPIQVEISQIAEVIERDLRLEERFSDQKKQSLQLVDQISKVGPMGIATLVLGVSRQTYGSVRESERQTFVPRRVDSILITKIPTEEVAHLGLYGRVAPDFYGEYQFTVHPVLKISAIRTQQHRLIDIKRQKKKRVRRSYIMRRGKRATALMVAISMAVSGTMVVYAVGAPATTGSTTIAGIIKIISIQVVVPMSATSDIDPNVKITEGAAVAASSDESNTSQIMTQASDYVIENTSKVPLVISVTGIITKNKTGGTEGTPALVNTTRGLTGKNVTFAVRKTRESINYPGASSNTTGVWVITETVREDSPYNMTKDADDSIIAAGVKFAMTLFGATGSGWNNGDSFQIIPTFTIALK